MKETSAVIRIREAMAQMGPIQIEDLHSISPEVFREHSERELASMMRHSNFFSQDDTGRWVLTTESPEYSHEHFPPDMEPLDSGHKFYRDLADLVESYAGDDGEKYKWWCACVAFGEYWKGDPGGY